MDGSTRLFTGWMTIFQNTERIQFLITNTKIRMFENIIAIVVCLENIQSNVNQNKMIMRVIATNIFERQPIVKNNNNNNDEEKWLMMHHHGSLVSNYIPPNVSV